MSPSSLALISYAIRPHIDFPLGGLVNEQIVLRSLHFIAGIIWIGLLYFFNLVGFPTMRQLDASVRAKLIPVLMTRAMWWFRWSAVVTVLAGMRYFSIILTADAQNAGDPALAWRWMGSWLLVWIGAFALMYPFQLPSKGVFNSPWLRTIAIAIIVSGASWVVLDLNANSQSSNSHLAISVGGGIGLLMLLNAALPRSSPRNSGCAKAGSTSSKTGNGRIWMTHATRTARSSAVSPRLPISSSSC